MDNRKRRLLQINKKPIVEDLDINHIIDELISKNVIALEEVERIINLSDRAEKSRALLECLENADDNAYQAFLDSLEKDYKWLWQKLSFGNNEEIFVDSFEDSLNRGDVPRLPNYYVRRFPVEKELEIQLKSLTRHKFLVLLGMLGSGKTSVVISVLRNNPDIITDIFNGNVFWLNLSDCKNEYDVTMQQKKLYRKSSIWTSNSFMNSSISMSSIGSNGDITISAGYESSWEDLRDKLKLQFSNEALKSALLVLDEVHDKKSVEAFDIGCKILITTRNNDIANTFASHTVTIKNSLTEDEILEFFANCLDVSVPDLPRQAKKLQEIFKEKSPFHIGLMGAQLAVNRESLVDNGSPLWKDYLKTWGKKGFFFFPSPNDKPANMVKFCVNSLEPPILSLFKMLAILPDNVKVSVKVLSKLWHKSVPETDNILTQLQNKSLINRSYNVDQKNYVYETHELILNFLKTCITREESEKLHCEFLKSYHYDKTDDTTVQIIDDGYIASFVGYHLANTNNFNNKWDLFNRLYLDLKFLGNKVRLTGEADVMYDLKKYEKYIVKEHLDIDFLDGIVTFLKTYGIDLYRYPYTDIVQSILQHESKGILFTKAYDIAQTNCTNNELYFDFSHEQNVEEIKHSTIDIKEKITSSCFLGDFVLVGTQAGVIKMFNCQTSKLKRETVIGTSPIKWVGACPIRPTKVAILSTDGVITLWSIGQIEQEDSENVIEEEYEAEDHPCDCPSSIKINPKMRPHLNCRWANNKEVLIAHTSKTFTLYHINGDVLQVVDNMDRNNEILCCTLCNDDRLIIAAVCNIEKYSVVVIDSVTQEMVMSFGETGFIVDIFIVPDIRSNKIITLKENEVTQHKFKINPTSYQNKYVCSSEKIISCDDVKENLKFLSSTVNKTGTLLFISTCDRRVICVDLKTNTHTFDIENRRGNIISMAVSEIPGGDDFETGMDVLLTGTGTEENSAKIWFLDPAYVSQKRQRVCKVRLTKKFAVSFVNTLSPQTPNPDTIPNVPSTQSLSATPKRHQSFADRTQPARKPALKTLSLDRCSLKPLNLKGLCNNNENCIQPLLAVVDDKNNIQVMRGRKVLTEIATNADDRISVVKISPCNQFIIYGLLSGTVNKYALRSKDTEVIMTLTSSVQYLNFVNPCLLIVSDEKRCLMAYHSCADGKWKSEMLQRGNCHLGSQEMLNDIQGIKKKNGHTDSLSDTGSTSGENGLLPDCSALVDCFWVSDGLITIECNAVIKLWSPDFKLESVLNGRNIDVRANCAACQKNILVICDSPNMAFHIFQITKVNDRLRLNLKQRHKLDSAIVSCDLTADGTKLALGLDIGDIVLWNVSQKRQITTLKHHKSKVQWCSFSPVPDNIYRTPAQSPSVYPSPPSFSQQVDDNEPPLVLVTMATEIVWWNISRILKNPKRTLISNTNIMSPLVSPIDNRNEFLTPVNNYSNGPSNIFFGNGSVGAHDCWKSIWKNKKCKEGSKREEILACIKLSGMNAEQLCHNEQFSCFVTVDNSGHVHIMNVMRPNT
ncbi:apaf-1 protein isoform 1-T2 [Aphomia sociella]